MLGKPTIHGIDHPADIIPSATRMHWPPCLDEQFRHLFFCSCFAAPNPFPNHFPHKASLEIPGSCGLSPREFPIAWENCFALDFSRGKCWRNAGVRSNPRHQMLDLAEGFVICTPPFIKGYFRPFGGPQYPR